MKLIGGGGSEEGDAERANGKEGRRAEAERRRRLEGASNGGARHLVEIYAHNAVLEVIQRARDTVRAERGRFYLPSKFMDELILECEGWILERGAEEAERRARERMLAILTERERLKREEDERKVRLRLPQEQAETGNKAHNKVQSSTNTPAARQ
ncbi:MAG: hypothetical protein QXH42_04875 [Thermoplasmata archaeon]